MGFRQDGYLTIWEVTPRSENITSARVTSSRKNKQTGEYSTDFSGFVSFIGTAVAGRALSLKEKDRIRVKACDVTNVYDKEKKVTYWNPNIYDFEMADFSKSNDGVSANVVTGDEEIDEDSLPY